MAENHIIKPLDLEKCFFEEPEPLDFVFPGLLAGAVGALVGTGGSSKSAFALQGGIKVAGGPDLLDLAGIDTDWTQASGRVVYVAAEDPELLLRHRLHNLGSRLSSEERQNLAGQLEVLPCNGLGLDVSSESWKQWLYSVADGARLVIIDTLRRVHQLDENESGAMASLIGLLESVCYRTGTSVLYVHHTNKAGAVTGEATATRGSSVLTDNVRLQLNLVTMQPDEAKKLKVDDDDRKRYVRLVYAKTNYCAPYADRWYKRADKGILVPHGFDLTKRGQGGGYSC